MVGLVQSKACDACIHTHLSKFLSSFVCKSGVHIQMFNEERHERRRSESKVRQLWLTPLLMHMLHFPLKCKRYPVFLSLKTKFHIFESTFIFDEKLKVQIETTSI